MVSIRLDTSYVDDVYVSRFEEYTSAIMNASQKLSDGTGKGSEYLGWLRLPHEYDKSEFSRIQETASRLRGEIDVLVVIGIGGSYLGARAVIELLSHTYHNELDTPKIYYLGNHMGSDEIQDTLDVLSGKEVAVNVVSKSGTTTEPAIAFRIMKQWMENEYGKDGARSRIFATTDAARGALKDLADDEGYETFVVPDDVGGRYSVLTAVGLFPIAVAGIDIAELMSGAADVIDHADKYDPLIAQYVAYRHVLHEGGKSTELFTNFTPSAHYLGEWWKQLFGESEGKEGKGIYPDTLDFSTDLHSLGQYVQEGHRIFFQTCLHFDSGSRDDLHLPADKLDLDELNYLLDKSIREINTTALQATMHAHQEGGVPSLIIYVEKKDARNLGRVLYFFEKACAISGYVLGVNPFNQPGVEAYKKKMFELLGKPKR